MSGDEFTQEELVADLGRSLWVARLMLKPLPPMTYDEGAPDLTPTEVDAFNVDERSAETERGRRRRCASLELALRALGADPERAVRDAWPPVQT